jgi:hypothetical protein
MVEIHSVTLPAGYNLRIPEHALSLHVLRTVASGVRHLGLTVHHDLVQDVQISPGGV